jgi:hypothetical protein
MTNRIKPGFFGRGKTIWRQCESVPPALSYPPSAAGRRVTSNPTSCEPMTSIPITADLLPSSSTLCPVAGAVAELAEASIEERGAIFTRREVVDFILDLSGYTADRPLHRMRHLEPSFGGGDFLVPVIERLLAAWKADSSRSTDAVHALAGALRAVELHPTTFSATRREVIAALKTGGINEPAAEVLADTWLIQGDFLLIELNGLFDFVVGNPPYVRQALIPDGRLAAYRARYATLYERADLYIPFLERSLSLLATGGHLGFICADRWMKNRYGGPLREFVARNFHLKLYVDMANTPAFQTEVIAYPAITIIARQLAGATRIAHRPVIETGALQALARDLLASDLPAKAVAVWEINGVAAGAQPWIVESSDQLALVRRLESDFPALEEAGCKVGIGVATGADKAFIAPFDRLDVELDRKLPLVMTQDITGSSVAWRGFGVINPLRDDGGLVDLSCFPKLRRYLEAHRDQLAKRHIAQKAPANWYRPIDRIDPALTSKPKLLIPDIKRRAHIVYEEGRLYPHHNLYFITSDEWDLRALQAVLLGGIARLFVSLYSTRMQGGFLRFQAQYLRRIRIPYWSQVPESLKQDLLAAAQRKDLPACTRAVFRLYGLSHSEREALGGNGD